MIRLEPSLECFDGQLRCLVRPCAERLAGIDTNRQPIVGNRRILPAGNDIEVIADREARIRFLPLLRPIAFFDDRPRNSRTLAPRAAEQAAYIIFDTVEIAAQTEIEDEACKPRFRRVALPDTIDTMGGKFPNNGVDQIVWNIDSELVPRHEIR